MNSCQRRQRWRRFRFGLQRFAKSAEAAGRSLEKLTASVSEFAAILTTLEKAA